MLRFSKGYFLFAIIIFITELAIAIFVHDHFIRPYLGDVLAVILIYCFVKAFFNFRKIAVATGVLLFAFVLELGQYFSLLDKLELQHSLIAKIILGTSFSRADILTYVIGIAIVLCAEYCKGRKIL